MSAMEEVLRRLIEEGYGALAWLDGSVQLSDRARTYKVKKLREALVLAKAAIPTQEWVAKVFDPMCDIPETDEQAKIALQRDDELLTNLLVGFYETHRAEGKTVLEAFEVALDVHIAAYRQKNTGNSRITLRAIKNRVRQGWRRL